MLDTYILLTGSGTKHSDILTLLRYQFPDIKTTTKDITNLKARQRLEDLDDVTPTQLIFNKYDNNSDYYLKSEVNQEIEKIKHLLICQKIDIIRFK